MPGLLSYRMGPSLARREYLLGGQRKMIPLAWDEQKNQGKRMKLAKLPLITTLLAFSLALASTAAAGAPAEQPAAEGEESIVPGRSNN